MIMRSVSVALAILVAGMASAQQEAERGSGVVLRWLDKINSETKDIEIANSSAAQIGTLKIELGECRYPRGNPSGDAYAFLTMHNPGEDKPVFSGWMIASSPALNALEHPRYDVWVLRCISS